MRIANGVEMLEITAHFWLGPSTIHPVLIWDEETVVLVDTGYPGQLPLIREGMEKAGVPLHKLNKVILTHQDLDHIGSLPSILQEVPHKVDVLANELERPYIEGEKRLLKITEEVLAQLDSLPEEWRAGVKRLFANPPRANVDKTVADGEELPYGGGITVVDTPGHTPGHISLYHQKSKTLIAGDAMTVADGQLFGPDSQHTYDMKLAVQSLKRLARYDIERVICYHGGLYEGNANKRIAELANG
jgi:glyoxylase-like metal-dependent hydrolase (beta-lactamase superfamily II)